MTDELATVATPEQPSLVTKLAQVMAAVHRIPKRGRNDFHKYDYATEADIVATVRQELAVRHVMLIPSITDMLREPVGEKGSTLTTLKMEFTFVDGDSGETLTRPWLGAGTDKEDKGAYKAMTGGEKYFLLKTFLIPTGDDPEHDPRKPSKAVVAPDAPTTVIDVSTGAEVLASVRPTPPEGYRYIDRYWQEGDWHHVEFLKMNAQGGAMSFKTKLSRVGDVARQAFQDGVPVRPDVTPNRKPGEEGFLNKVTTWLPEDLSIHTEPVDADSIPF